MLVGNLIESEKKEQSELIQAGRAKIIEEIKNIISKKFCCNNSLYSIGIGCSKNTLIAFNAWKEYLNSTNRAFNFSSYQGENQNIDDIFLETDDEKHIKSRLSEEIRVFNYTKPFKTIRSGGEKPNQKFIAQFTHITLNFKDKRIDVGITESFFNENINEVMIEKYCSETVSIFN